MNIWTLGEASGSHLGGILEAGVAMERHLGSRNHPAGTQETPRCTQETPRRHPGDTQETPRGTQRHPGGTQEDQSLKTLKMINSCCLQRI